MIKKILTILIVLLTHLSHSQSLDSLIISKQIDSIETNFKSNTDGYIKYALKLHKQIKQHKTIYFNTRLNATLASIYKYLHQFDSALFWYQQSIKQIIGSTASLQKSDPSVAMLLSEAYNDIAEIHSEIGNYDQAMDYNQKSSAINRKYDLENREINALITRGKIAMIQNKYDEATQNWLDGLQLAKKLNETDLKARLFNNLGTIHYRQSNWKKCLEYFEQAYQLQKKSGNETELAQPANNVGLTYLMLKNYSKAEQFLTEAYELGCKHHLISSQGIALHYLIETYAYSNQGEKARKAFLLFEEVLDEMYNHEKTAKIDELETKYQTEKKEQEIKALQQENELKNQTLLAQRRLILLIVVGVILLIIVGVSYYLWHNDHQKNIRNQLKIKNLLTEQKLLRSQMNPHFIYNSLNSIQSFISSDDSYNAEKYLARFAKLMRGILENSRADYITLDKEIEVLQLYMELEQLRFNNRFTFSFDIHEKLETDFIAIPPMLIQPFIENAILHGLKTKHDGHIHVIFKEDNNCLVCVVDDNGIGRKASAETQTTKKHQSLATTIVTERLETLTQKYGQPAFFTIEDKADSTNHEPLGTKVTLTLPLIEA